MSTTSDPNCIEISNVNNTYQEASVSHENDNDILNNALSEVLSDSDHTEGPSNENSIANDNNEIMQSHTSNFKINTKPSMNRPTSSVAVSTDFDVNIDSIDDKNLSPTEMTFTTTVKEKPSYLELFTNELFYSRIIIFLITIFLFILSLCYTFGQILTLELADFWCNPVSYEEVRAYSIELGSNTGYNGESSCLRVKRSPVK